MTQDLIIETLKRILKAKKINYKILAYEMGMSESGVKKLLSSKDISLGRLQRITEILGISLVDIFKLVEEEEIKNVTLTTKQENFLFENTIILRIFWYIGFEEKSLDEIKRLEKITKEQLDRYLMKLENIDLIKINNGKIAFVNKGLYRWVGDGKLLKKLNKEWSENTLQKVLRDKGNAENLHRLSYLKLTEESRQKFFERLNELTDEFARKSQREKIEKSAQVLKSLSLLFAISPTSFLE